MEPGKIKSGPKPRSPMRRSGDFQPENESVQTDDKEPADVERGAPDAADESIEGDVSPEAPEPPIFEE